MVGGLIAEHTGRYGPWRACESSGTTYQIQGGTVSGEPVRALERPTNGRALGALEGVFSYVDWSITVVGKGAVGIYRACTAEAYRGFGRAEYL